MSEEKKFNVFEAFQATQLSFNEAEEKVKQEAGRAKVENFRISEDGEYQMRVLPLAPCFDENGQILPLDRKGYEYPFHQMWLKIKLPNKKGGKSKFFQIPVVKATDKGVDFSVDLIDTYVKIAKEMYGDDEDVMKKLSESSYQGGLRYDYKHAMMVIDVSSDKERAKGPQLWTASHSQYKDLEATKMRLWRELCADDPNTGCPITSFQDAYPVKVIRETENKKTSYIFEIGRKTVPVTEAELLKLLDLPRIPEQIFRYTRYQMEATIEFLKQYDEALEIEVCKEPDFKEAVEKLSGELPADDTSHFSLAETGNKKNDASEEVTIDSLWNEYDIIADKDLGEKSEEYMELREKIQKFIKDNNLDVRISRSKNNRQLLEEIDEVIDGAENNVPTPKAKAVESEEDDEVAEEAEEKEQPAEEAPARQRRPRPTEEDEESETEAEAPEAEETEAPARRTRLRRTR